MDDKTRNAIGLKKFSIISLRLTVKCQVMLSISGRLQPRQ